MMTHKKPPRKVVPFIFLAVLSILSLRQLIYLFQLFRVSINPPASREMRSDLMAKNFLRNDRLAAVVRDHFMDSEPFFASYAAELGSRDLPGQLESRHIAFLPDLRRMFPENIFLNRLGFSEANGAPEEWKKFDALDLKLFKEVRFNNLTFPALTQRLADDIIPEKILPDLIYYLNWVENFALAEALLNWSSEKGLLRNDQDESLRRDLIRRKTAHLPDEESYQPAAHASSFIFLNGGDLKIELKRNLMTDGSFKKSKSLTQFWEFTDNSERERISSACFFGGIDSFEGSSMRVMNLSSGVREGTVLARAGFMHRERIFLAEKTYVFCFAYKTQHNSEVSSLWLHNTLREPRTVPSSSSWKTLYYIFDNSLYKLGFVRPILRMWGTGSVWFDSIGLFEIELEGTPIVKDAIFIQ